MRSVACIAFICVAVTAQSPQLVRDINAHPVPAESAPQHFTRAGAYTYFSARTASSGRELWRSDGTVAGTIQLTEAAASIADADPYDLTPFGPQLLFTTGNRSTATDLWVTDGSARGTVRLRQFRGLLRILPATLPGVAFAVTNGGLWRTDGTVSGTTLVRAMPEAALQLAFAAEFSSDLLFTHFGALWRTDGTAARNARSQPG